MTNRVVKSTIHKMRIIALDIESFFSSDYTLSKSTTESYVRDPRFEAHGAAIKMGAGLPAIWHDAQQLKPFLDAIDWSNTACICHHAHFDGLILSQHYGVRPKFWLDTLSMARLLLGNHLSVSLDSVRKHFGMAAKRTPYEVFKGKHWNELRPDEQRLIADGCEDEVESIWTLFGRLAQDFPRGEYELVDQTVRMFTEPTLRGDIELLGEIWRDEDERKSDVMALLGCSTADLQSSDRFSNLLRAEGIEPALKQGKNGPIYAFAKTDDFMKELLDHDDPRVSGLARARLGIKSTAIQTRVETLGFMAGRGPLTVYLRYAGAATTRWSGGDGSNFQNFRRGSELRRTILAPEGYDLAVIDSSQIECRLLNWLAGQWDVVERFRTGGDPYSVIASEFYGRPITKADPNERGTGKQAELSCGYGCGGPKFKRTAALGIYGPPVSLTDEESQRAVDLYRRSHVAVTNYWRAAEQILGCLARGDRTNWGPMRIENHRMYTPSGVPLIYDTLVWDAELDENGYPTGYKLKTRQGWTRMWGSKLVQHVCEALAREIVGAAMIKIGRAGLRVVGMSHDEIWVLLPNEPVFLTEVKFEIQNDVKGMFEWCLATMRVSPAWAPDLPLDAEGSYGSAYSK